MSTLKTMTPIASVLALLLATAACSETTKAPAQSATTPTKAATTDDMAGMKVDKMSDMDSPKAVVAHGVDVVNAIDTKSITIAHGPIAEVGWPAMTMAFPVADTKLLAGIKVGTKVGFTFSSESMANNTITELKVVK